MARHGNGATAKPSPASEPASASASASTDALDLKARLDRYGEILAKGLDLAEAGLALGLRVITTVGDAAQQKILDRLAEAAASELTPAAPTAGPSAPSPPPTETAKAPAYGITNRLPLVPGAPFRVSFSINNDNPLAAKQVLLAVEAFAGERTGALLSPSTLAVSPNAAAIAPMDFEKFVLHGAIPPETPPDVYDGAVTVGAEGGMRIPVRLVVEPRGAA
jgi:hypothetical protein